MLNINMIHPLWIVCLLTRLVLALNLAHVPVVVPFIMGLGFIYKGLTGSNDEVQVAKVFWHETRYFHGIMYLMAAYYMFNGNIKIATIVLLLDLLFSIIYRITI